MSQVHILLRTIKKILNFTDIKFRDDYNNKMVNEITRAKLKYITIEDLKVSNMIKNKNLSKAIQEQNFYAIRIKLINKCKERNIELRLVDIFYPSSKTCSCCGNVKRDLKLNDRIYKCCNCSLEIDRDYNESINLEQVKVYKVIAQIFKKKKRRMLQIVNKISICTDGQSGIYDYGEYKEL